MTTKAQVSRRWGLPFWQVVADLAVQGLLRSEAARALGYTPEGFLQALRHAPPAITWAKRGPTGRKCRPRGTGQRLLTLADLDRYTELVRAGKTQQQAAAALGFSTRTIQRAMKEHRPEVRRTLPVARRANYYYGSKT